MDKAPVCKCGTNMVYDVRNIRYECPNQQCPFKYETSAPIASSPTCKCGRVMRWSNLTKEFVCVNKDCYEPTNILSKEYQIKTTLAISTIGAKHDSNKPRWDLLPWTEISQVVDVLTFGAKKYDDNNWQKVQSHKDRYFSAFIRHVFAWWSGEVKDKESGLPHLAHAVCCLLFLMWFDNKESK